MWTVVRDRCLWSGSWINRVREEGGGQSLDMHGGMGAISGDGPKPFSS